MSKYRFAALITAVTLITVIPFAQAGDPEGQASKAVEQTEVIEQVNPNKRVCKKVKSMGSHITQKVCLKQRDWEAIARKEEETLRDWSNSQSSSPNSARSVSQ